MSMPFICFPDDLKDRPIRLHEGNLECPLRVVDMFFRHYNLNHIRQKLQEFLVIALSSNIADMECPLTRNSLILLVHHIETLIEANYVMFNDYLPLKYNRNYRVRVKDYPKLKIVSDAE